MGKADTPSDKHLRGVSLPLRQAGAALARAQARALARSTGGSVPPRPSPRQRAGERALGSHSSGAHSASPHSSGTHSVANRNGELGYSAELAPSTPAERSASGVAPVGRPRAGTSVASSGGASSGAVEPVGSELGDASVGAETSESQDTPLASPTTDNKGAAAARGLEAPQPASGVAASAVPVGLPDFDVFDADIFEADDDFEEAEDTVADVLTPGVVVRKTPPRRDSVPHASLKRPTAEHEVGMSREAEVPRVSLVSNTGTMAPAVTLGPDDPQLVGAELLVLPANEPPAHSPRRGWLAALAYDVRCLRRELIPCSIIGCVLAAIVFVVGQSILQERGLIASHADSADTPLVNPSAAHQPALMGTGVAAVERGVPGRRELVGPGSSEAPSAPAALKAESTVAPEQGSKGRELSGSSALRGELSGGAKVTGASAAGQPEAAAAGDSASSPSGGGEVAQSVDKPPPNKRRRRAAKRRRSAQAKARRKARRSSRKSTPQGPTPAESAGLEESMPF